MKTEIHVGLNQVENGWVVTVVKPVPFKYEPEVRTFIAPTLESACTMIVADITDSRGAAQVGGDWESKGGET